MPSSFPPKKKHKSTHPPPHPTQPPPFSKLLLTSSSKSPSYVRELKGINDSASASASVDYVSESGSSSGGSSSCASGASVNMVFVRVDVRDCFDDENDDDDEDDRGNGWTPPQPLLSGQFVQPPQVASPSAASPKNKNNQSRKNNMKLKLLPYQITASGVLKDGGAVGCVSCYVPGLCYQGIDDGNDEKVQNDDDDDDIVVEDRFGYLLRLRTDNQNNENENETNAKQIQSISSVLAPAPKEHTTSTSISVKLKLNEVTQYLNRYKSKGVGLWLFDNTMFHDVILRHLITDDKGCLSVGVSDGDNDNTELNTVFLHSDSGVKNLINVLLSECEFSTMSISEVRCLFVDLKNKTSSSIREDGKDGGNGNGLNEFVDLFLTMWYLKNEVVRG